MQEAPAQQVGARQHLAGPTRPASQATPQASRRPGPSLPLQRPPQRCPPQQPCSPKPLPGTMSCLHCARRTFSLAGLNSSPKLDQNFWEIFPGFSWDSWLPPTPTSAQDTCLGRRKVDRLPGAWARLVAALLLLAVGLSLAARQLHARGDPTGSPGSGVAPPSGHSHTPGVYHRGATISPAGQCREVLGKGRWGGGLAADPPHPTPSLPVAAMCSHLGRELLAAGGNVVDAGVGAALCLAVVHPHATGLGQ